MSNSRKPRRDVQGALILIAPDGRVEINPDAVPEPGDRTGRAA